MKDSLDLGLVLVNYNNYSDTIEYVNSFLDKIDTKSFFIVVVDGCSSNESIDILKKEFRNNDKIAIISAEVNKGYSYALNVGFSYLNQRFNCKFIIGSNADIVLLDEHFFEHIDKEFERSHFAVLAPMIKTPDGRCDSNPIFDIEYTRGNALYDLKYWKKRLRATRLGLDRLYCFYRKHNVFIRRYKRKYYVKRKIGSPNSFLERKEDIVPHGCFWLFSKEYFSVFDGLDARTFLYAEEDILYAHLISKNLKTVYLPEAVIYHKGGGSFDTLDKATKQKKVFIFKCYISAIETYLGLLNELGR